jgi:hypothetical protein
MSGPGDRDRENLDADAIDAAHALSDEASDDVSDNISKDVEGGPPDDDPGWPWSFLLLVAAGAAYLIFRFVELGIKLFS